MDFARFYLAYLNSVGSGDGLPELKHAGWPDSLEDRDPGRACKQTTALRWHDSAELEHCSMVTGRPESAGCEDKALGPALLRSHRVFRGLQRIEDGDHAISVTCNVFSMKRDLKAIGTSASPEQREGRRIGTRLAGKTRISG